jgi:hypothetical protein
MPPLVGTPAHAVEAGAALATLHLLALPTDRPVSQPPPAPLGARWLNWQPAEEHWRSAASRAAQACRPWAKSLETLIPTLLAAAGVCRDISDEPAILSKCGLGIGDMRPGPDGGWVFLGWEHTGPLPSTYDFGGCVAGFDEDALTRGYVEGYRRAGGTVPSLDLGLFTTAISAQLNWMITRINIALTDTDEERRDLAEREVPLLLASPPTLERYERLLALFA